MAIDIARGLQRIYGEAHNKVRRDMNQVFFEKLLLDNDGVTGSELRLGVRRSLGRRRPAEDVREAHGGRFFRAREETRPKTAEQRDETG